MKKIDRIFAQKKLNNQASSIQIPQAFTNKFPTFPADKAEKIFRRYVEAVCGAFVRQSPYIKNNRCQMSFEAMFNECSTFNIKGVRYSVWNEFKEICPLFTVVEIGSNIKGENSIVEINDRMLKKLLDYTNPDKIEQALFADAEGDAEWVQIDMKHLADYIANTEYDLSRNLGTASNAFINTLKRNYYQAQIVHRIASNHEGMFPQYAKPSTFGRTYYHGLSIQSMSRQVRDAALGAHFQYDMSAAIYGIKLAIMNEVARSKLGNKQHIENDLFGLFTYTKQYLQEKDEIRKRLAEECFADVNGGKFKDRVKFIKQAMTAIGFGAETDLSGWWSEDMALPSILRNPVVRDRFLNDSFIQKFAAEQEEISASIVDFLKAAGQYDTVKAAIKSVRGRKKITNAHIAAYVYQHYETTIMDEVVEIAALDAPVVARIHDAFVTRHALKDQTVEAIEDALSRHHSLLKLERSEGDLWRPVEQRKKQEAETVRIAGHEARMKKEQDDAIEFIEFMGSNMFAGTAPKKEMDLEQTWDYVIRAALSGKDVKNDHHFLDLSEVYGDSFFDEFERRIDTFQTR
jgi:hypothetical protein